MANERQIKGRIKSAKNISQITKAMQMVAASKMRLAQAQALAGRPYADKIAETVQEFVSRVEPKAHRLLQKNLTGKRVIILISTNKGLLGGLNTNLFRKLIASFTEEELATTVFVTMGKKGEQFLVRSHRKLLADFSSTLPFSKNIPALTQFVIDGYYKGEFSEVYVVYNNFITALSQEPTLKKLLPITQMVKEGQKVEKNTEYLVEPAIESILDTLLIHYLENQIRDAVFEAEASEHSARMIAMKNATDNALEFTALLTLEYNRARQEKITYEIADMVTARAAFE